MTNARSTVVRSRSLLLARALVLCSMPFQLAASPDVAAVLNGASFSEGPLAAGAIISIFGTGLAGSIEEPRRLPLPTELGGTIVRVNSQPIPLFFVSPRQINAQLPFGLPEGSHRMTVRDGAGDEGSISITITGATPGVFTVTSDGVGEAIATHADFSLIERVPAFNATIGETIIVFCTGLGDVDNIPGPGAPAPVSPLARTRVRPEVLMAGRPAKVTFSGLAPGFVGLYQINFVVPDHVGGDVVTTIRMGDAVGNDVTISVAGEFFLFPDYSGPLEFRSTGDLLQLEFFNFERNSATSLVGRFLVSDELVAVDGGSFEADTDQIIFHLVLQSVAGDVFEALMDTLDAGKSFIGILFRAGDDPQNWFAAFEVSSSSPSLPGPTPDLLPGVGADCQRLEGAFLFGDDGAFLGRITSDTFSQDSIGNAFGPFGSEFSPTSIFNRFGRYGSEFSDLSAFNEFATRPPTIVINDRAVAFLTVNTLKTPRVDLRIVLECVGR